MALLRFVRWRRVAGPALAAVAIAGLSVACGSGHSTSTSSKPETTVTVPADFGSLPRYPGSQEAGSLTQKDGTDTQSFQVTDASPQQVLAFYTANLVGWTNSEAPHALGQSPQSAWRGQWQLAGATVIVSSEPAPGLGPNSEQYSLRLQLA